MDTFLHKLHDLMPQKTQNNRKEDATLQHGCVHVAPNGK